MQFFLLVRRASGFGTGIDGIGSMSGGAGSGMGKRSGPMRGPIGIVACAESHTSLGPLRLVTSERLIDRPREGPLDSMLAKRRLASSSAWRIRRMRRGASSNAVLRMGKGKGVMERSWSMKIMLL